MLLPVITRSTMTLCIRTEPTLYLMDAITKELRDFLVKMHYEPGSVSHKMEHYIEHLTHLLPVDEEEDLLHYFGILDHDQLSLDEIAQKRRLSSDAVLSSIDKSLRKLAITPEWEMLKHVSARER